MIEQFKKNYKLNLSIKTKKTDELKKNENYTFNYVI